MKTCTYIGRWLAVVLRDDGDHVKLRISMGDGEVVRRVPRHETDLPPSPREPYPYKYTEPGPVGVCRKCWQCPCECDD